MAITLHEFDTVELVTPIVAERIWFSDLYGDPHLQPGDQGAVIDLHPDGSAAVEFMRGERTVALVDVLPDEVRVLTTSHTRPASVAAPTD